ncbi:pilus assembly FimT family protein [Variovorax sp. 22077]|uniref:pilus assembly FimT family protein n=1 Tax=Variovorax sp. 22077 TaxID=3453867 RepID=UPI003F82A8C3
MLNVGLGHLSRRRATMGFTLIELMVTISVLAVMLGIAAPLLIDFVRNNKVRAVANTLQNGLRTAQTEAMRRNQQVVFILTNATPSGDTPVAAAINGKHWAAYTVVPDGSSESMALLDTGVIDDVGSEVAITGPAVLCFSSLGRLKYNSAPGITGKSCELPSGGPAQIYGVALTGATRSLRVLVNVGGQVRMCDPSKTFDATTTPDGCPA